jgi:hypothetical protein
MNDASSKGYDRKQWGSVNFLPCRSYVDLFAPSHSNCEQAMLSFLIVFNSQNQRLRFSRVWDRREPLHEADKETEFFKLVVRKASQSVTFALHGGLKEQS